MDEREDNSLFNQRGQASRSNPAVNASDGSKANTSHAASDFEQNLSQAHLDRIHMLQSSDVENLKDLLSGSPLTVPSSYSLKNLLPNRSDSEHRDVVDGLAARADVILKQEGSTTEQLPNKSDLMSIHEDGSEEPDTQAKETFDSLLNLISTPVSSHRVLDVLPEHLSPLSSPVPPNDKCQQVDYSSLLQCHLLLSSTRSDIDVYKYAVTVAISECLACHSLYDNLEAAGIDPYHPADDYEYNPFTSDACAQAIQVQPVLPSQELQTCVLSADHSVQCELVSPDDLEDEASEDFLRDASMRASKKSVTILEANAWLKNSTDMAVTCRLPASPQASPDASHGPGVTLTTLIKQVVSSSLRKSVLSSELVQELIGYSFDRIMDSLCEMSTHLANVPTDSQLVNWLMSVGFLASLEQLLSTYMLQATAVLQQPRAVYKLTHRVEHQVRDTSLTAAKTDGLTMTFTSTLTEMPVVEESVTDKLSRGRQRFTFKPSTGASDATDASLVSGATLSSAVGIDWKSAILRAGPEQGNKWTKVKELALLRKKSRGELIRLKRMTFLDSLLNELSREEMSLVQAVFLSINKSHSAFISVLELKSLLEEAFTQTFTEITVRRILHEVDVDGDGCLCLLDLFSVFYLTEIYMQALGDGFRDQVLADASKAFSASHALLFIAISELCFYSGFRLSMNNNILIRQCEKSNALRCRGELGGLSWGDLDLRACRLFCFSLIGLDNGILLSISYGINDISRLKLSPFWCDDSKAHAKYKKVQHRFRFEDVALQVFEKHKKKKLRFFKMMYDLARPTIPNIAYKPIKSSVEFEPPYVYCYQGKETFMRQLDTGAGFEHRSDSVANKFALGLLLRLEKRGVTLVKLFLEEPVFHSRKLQNIVKTFCYNGIPMWPRAVPKENPFVIKQQQAEARKSAQAETKATYGGAAADEGSRKSAGAEVTLPDVFWAISRDPRLKKGHVLNASFLEKSSIDFLLQKYRVRDEKRLTWGQIRVAKALREQFHEIYCNSLKANSARNSINWWLDMKSELDVKPHQLPPIHSAFINYLPQKVERVFLPPIECERGSGPHNATFSGQPPAQPPFKNLVNKF